MNRSLLSLDFYGNGITAALAYIDEDTQTLRICRLFRKRSRAFAGALVRDLAAAQNDLQSFFEEIFEYVNEVPSVIIGIRGSFLSFSHRSGYAAVSSPNRYIRQPDIDDAQQNAIPPNLDETMEVMDILPLSYSLDGSEEITDPMGMNGFMLGVETFMSIVQSSHLANLNKVLATCNCKDYQVLASAVALGETLLKSSEQKGNSLVLDIGENSTSAVLYVQGAAVDGWEINKGFNILIKKAADLLVNDEDTTRQVLLDNPPNTDPYTDELWEDSAEYLLQLLKEDLRASFRFIQNNPSQLILSGEVANPLVLQTAKAVFNTRKARIATFNDMIADCATDNPAYNGAIALIEHALSREAGEVTVTQVQEKGFLSGILSKFGLGIF